MITDEQIDALASANNLDKTWYENEPHRHWRAFARAIAAEAVRLDRERCEPLLEALKLSMKTLAVYMDLPSDRWPGPPTSAMAEIAAAIRTAVPAKE